MESRTVDQVAGRKRRLNPLLGVSHLIARNQCPVYLLLSPIYFLFAGMANGLPRWPNRRSPLYSQNVVLGAVARVDGRSSMIFRVRSPNRSSMKRAALLTTFSRLLSVRPRRTATWRSCLPRKSYEKVSWFPRGSVLDVDWLRALKPELVTAIPRPHDESQRLKSPCPMCNSKTRSSYETRHHDRQIGT